MCIAISGGRGVWTRWRGWGTIVTELAPRLVGAGHGVALFTMPRHTGEDVALEYRGVRVIRLPSRDGRSTETLIHELLSSLDVLTVPRQDAQDALGLSATGWGRLVLARDVACDREVPRGNGPLWIRRPGSLWARIQHVEAEGDALAADAAVVCRERIAACDGWDRCAIDHARFFRSVAREVDDDAHPL